MGRGGRGGPAWVTWLDIIFGPTSHRGRPTVSITTRFDQKVIFGRGFTLQGGWVGGFGPFFRNCTKLNKNSDQVNDRRVGWGGITSMLLVLVGCSYAKFPPKLCKKPHFKNRRSKERTTLSFSGNISTMQLARIASECRSYECNKQPL